MIDISRQTKMWLALVAVLLTIAVVFYIIVPLYEHRPILTINKESYGNLIGDELLRGNLPKSSRQYDIEDYTDTVDLSCLDGSNCAI